MALIGWPYSECNHNRSMNENFEYGQTSENQTPKTSQLQPSMSKLRNFENPQKTLKTTCSKHKCCSSTIPHMSTSNSLFHAYFQQDSCMHKSPNQGMKHPFNRSKHNDQSHMWFLAFFSNFSSSPSSSSHPLLLSHDALKSF